MQAEKNDPIFRSCLRIAQALMAYHRHEVVGIKNIPLKGPALIAVNHSLATYDSFLLGAAIYLQTGRFPYGLGDRLIFRTPGLAQLFSSLKVTEGSPAAGEALLQEGKIVILAPGGMRESLRPSSERYQIDWQGRMGFARLAIKMQVPVILAACPNADNIYTTYSNTITPFLYRHFKFPFPLALGIGPTLIPRPVKLTHYIHKAIMPPPLREENPTEKCVASFHGKLVSEMIKMMRQNQPSHS